MHPVAGLRRLTAICFLTRRSPGGNQFFGTFIFRGFCVFGGKRQAGISKPMIRSGCRCRPVNYSALSPFGIVEALSAAKTWKRFSNHSSGVLGESGPGAGKVNREMTAA